MKASSVIEQERLKRISKSLAPELESARANFETALNSAHEAQRSAESNIDELNEEIKSFESDISAFTDAKSVLESDLEEARSKVTEVRGKSFWTKELQKQLDSARFELENSESKVAAAEEKLRESEAELDDLRSKKNEELESSISSTSEALRLELEESATQSWNLLRQTSRLS